MYDEEDEYQDEYSPGVQGYIKKYFVFLIAIFLMWWFWRDTTWFVNQFLIGSFGIVVFVWFMNTSWWIMKHKSPKLIWNDGFTSTTGHFHSAGEWVIFAMEAIYWFNYEPRTGCVISPREAVNHVGRSVHLGMRGINLPFEELPEVVQDVIVEKGFKPPYIIGFADEDQYKEYLSDKMIVDLGPDVQRETGITVLKKPSVEKLVEKYKSECRQSNYYKNISKDKFETAEKFVSSAGRLSQEKRPTFKDRLMQRREEGTT